MNRQRTSLHCPDIHRVFRIVPSFHFTCIFSSPAINEPFVICGPHVIDDNKCRLLTSKTSDIKSSHATVATPCGKDRRHRRRFLDQSSPTVSNPCLQLHVASAADDTLPCDVARISSVASSGRTLPELSSVDSAECPETAEKEDLIATSHRPTQVDITEKPRNTVDRVFGDRWCSTPAKRRKTVVYKSATGIVYHKSSRCNASVTNGDSGAAWRRQGRDDEKLLTSSFSNAAAMATDGRRSSPRTIQQQTTDGDESQTKLVTLTLNSGLRETMVRVEENGKNTSYAEDENPASDFLANCRRPKERKLVDDGEEIDDFTGSAPAAETRRQLTYPQEVSGRRLLGPADDHQSNGDEIKSTFVDDLDDRNFKVRKPGHQSADGVDFAPKCSFINDLAQTCDGVAVPNQIVCFRRQRALQNGRRRGNWIPANFNNRKRKIIVGGSDELSSTLWTIERPLLLAPTSGVSFVQLHLNARCRLIQDNKDPTDSVEFSMPVGRRGQQSVRSHRQSAPDPVAVTKSPLLCSVVSAGSIPPLAIDQSAISAYSTHRQSTGSSMLSDRRNSSGHVVQQSPSLPSPPTQRIKPPAAVRGNCIVAIDRRPLLVLNRHCAVGEQLNAATGTGPFDAIFHGAVRTTGCFQWLPQPTASATAAAAIGVRSPYPTVFMYPPKTIGVPLNNRFGTSVPYLGTYSSTVAADRVAYGIGFERLSTRFFELSRRPVCHVEPPQFFIQHIL